MDSKLFQLQQLMTGYSRSWWVCGGWAVDLHLGRVTREHKDIEIAIPRADLPQLRRYFAAAEWEIVGKSASGPSGRRPLAAEASPEAGEHELYALLPGYGSLEVLLNEVEGPLWRYRRDLRVSLPLERFGLISTAGIPYSAPEAVLLYKAKGTRETDAQDFESLLSALNAEQRGWLREALQTAQPGHAWIARL